LVKPRISCFMIVRNTLSQGYPFVEAIAQALPVCDEMLVGDGGSTDGTLEILRRLEQLNPKIRVYVDPWPGKSFAHDLRWATNTLMQKCRGEYIIHTIHTGKRDNTREKLGVLEKHTRNMA